MTQRPVLIVDGLNLFVVCGPSIIGSMARHLVKPPSQETLLCLYVEQEKSMKEVATECGCSAQTVCNLLRRHNIAARDSRYPSLSTRHKMSQSKTGDKNPFYGKKRPEHSKKLKGRPRAPFSDATRLKMSKAKKGMWGGKYKGSNHPYWVPPELRKAPLYKQIRDCPMMREWRISIILRDRRTCRICGYQGNQIHVDHIKQLALIVQEQKITTKDQAEQCTELWDVNNGRVLCIVCHKQTPTWSKHLTTRKRA